MRKSILSIYNLVRLKTACSTTKSNYNIELLLVASLDMILSSERIIKGLIRLHRFAGWSAPLLFTNPEDSFLAPWPIWFTSYSVSNTLKDFH